MFEGVWLFCMVADRLHWTRNINTFIYVGEIEIMKMLLNNGIDVNVRLSENNNTLLHDICESSFGFTQINSRYLTINDKDYNLRNVPFELLLNHGADINAINSRGSTPIHLCAASSKIICVIFTSFVWKFKNFINRTSKGGQIACGCWCRC